MRIGRFDVSVWVLPWIRAGHSGVDSRLRGNDVGGCRNDVGGYGNGVGVGMAWVWEWGGCRNDVDGWIYGLGQSTYWRTGGNPCQYSKRAHSFRLTY